MKNEKIKITLLSYSNFKYNQFKKGAVAMDIIEHIFQYEEIINIERNNEIYDLVLNEFLNSSKKRFIFDENITSADKVRRLKNQYIYTSKDIKIFFNILAKYHYNMKEEIIDAMRNLGYLYDPTKNKKLIKKLLNSPVIQDISFNGKNKFTIFSTQYGIIEFELASSYFKNSPSMTNYMKTNSLPNRCHNHTYFMAHIFPELYSITSQCRYYFKGFYYHSYTYNQTESAIIDLCYNSIIDKNQYYNIFEPQNISVILNSNVDKELDIINSKTNPESNIYHLLKIALYKEYLQNIRYQGSLEDAPIIKKLQR